MDKAVAELNIEHCRKLLATETEPSKRATVDRLLAEKKANLAGLTNKGGPDPIPRGLAHIPQRRTNHSFVRCVSTA